MNESPLQRYITERLDRLQEEVHELRRLLEGFIDHEAYHKSAPDRDGCRYCY